MLRNFDYIVVGSGFYGSVIAERIANDLQKKVLIIEKSYHIGGNCYSEVDKNTGIEFHKYGTHIFHTSNKEVYDYLKRFCEFNSYYHQVLTTYNGKVYQMPINLETINSFFQINLRPYEVEQFLNEKINATNIEQPKNFEEAALKSIGKELYEAFIKGYTQKQWGQDPQHLSGSILKRLPVRKNYNESYFFDKWQGIPVNEFTEIFNKMLSGKNISILLNTDYFDIRNQVPPETKIIYTGPIDKYFDYCCGKLAWRSLKFEHEIIDVEDYQGTSVMNFADIDIPYTRIHEPKHLHAERDVFSSLRTLIIRENPQKDDENPYYPLADAQSEKILQEYQSMASTFKNLIIGGRLGDYKYYDIHHTIEKALFTYKTKIKNE